MPSTLMVLAPATNRLLRAFQNKSRYIRTVLAAVEVEEDVLGTEELEEVILGDVEVGEVHPSEQRLLWLEKLEKKIMHLVHMVSEL